MHPRFFRIWLSFFLLSVLPCLLLKLKMKEYLKSLYTLISFVEWKWMNGSFSLRFQPFLRIFHGCQHADDTKKKNKAQIIYKRCVLCSRSLKHSSSLNFSLFLLPCYPFVLSVYNLFASIFYLSVVRKASF